LSFEQRDIDYLWVNRIIPERHIDWVIEMAQKNEFRNKLFVLYGFLDDPYAKKKKEEIEALSLSNVSLFGYSDEVLSVYERARYFLLPADYVFGNNSLLEAMSCGAVPVITNVHGSDKLIQNENNGFISQNNRLEYLKLVEQLNSLPSEKWYRIADRASQTILDDYSLEKFKENIRLLYQKINDL
jgi:glycosyltransferase involved in cell wall biosynthesis